MSAPQAPDSLAPVPSPSLAARSATGAKVLVVAPSWIGDTVLAQPLLARLHASHPDLQIDVLAPSWVAPVLNRMAEVTEIIDSPFKHGELALKARYRLARQLAARDLFRRRSTADGEARFIGCGRLGLRNCRAGDGPQDR